MFSISVDASLTKASSTGSLIQVGNAIQLLLQTCELATNILRSPTNISFSQQISKRFGEPRWERSSSWFPGEAIPLQMPGGQKKQNKKCQVLIVCYNCDHQTAGGELLKEDWMPEQMQDGKVLRTNWWVNSNNVILLFSYLNSFHHFQWIDKVPRGLQEQHGIQGACHPHWLLPQHPWGGLEEGGKEVIWLILLLSLLLIIDQTSNLKVANVTSSSRPSGRQWSDCNHPNTLQ